MADKAGLGLVGVIFGGTTLAVMLIAGFVVMKYVHAPYALDGVQKSVVAAATQAIVR